MAGPLRVKLISSPEAPLLYHHKPIKGLQGNRPFYSFGLCILAFKAKVDFLLIQTFLLFLLINGDYA